MKLRKSRQHRRGRIEIIPMIDVMFFLLVTFMLASLSMQNLHSLAVNLPRGSASAMQPKTPVTLAITRDSRIFLDNTPVTLGDPCRDLEAYAQGAGLEYHCGGRQCGAQRRNRPGDDTVPQRWCAAFPDSGQTC